MARTRAWSSLSAELVEDISGRLTADADHVHFRQVCSQWRASTPPLAAPRPWAVAGRLPDGPDRWSKIHPVGRFSLWLPRGRDPVHVRAPHRLPHCYGAPRGWLALADHARSPTRFVLWDPVSCREIPLPFLPGVLQVFLSADPLAAPSSPEEEENAWMAVALASRRPEKAVINRLVYWRPGDGAWAALPGCHGVNEIYSVAFHRGRFYFTDMSGILTGYDLNPGGTASPPALVMMFSTDGALSPSICDCGASYHSVRAVHAVTCHGDLLLVAVGHALGRHPPVAGVFRPAVRAEFGGKAVEPGERVTDLGEYSLFLGRGDGFALSASEFPGIKRNRVYFLEHDMQYHQKYWMVVFDLSSGVIVEHVPYPQEHKEDGSNWLPFTWWCPRKPFLDQ
ncbi:hypothetical protein ACP70R_010831 [Stipagrostis hirtigluma subsp. patula]